MHRLALGLGRTVGEIEAQMPARELDDWMAFWAVEPWGAWRDNVHTGLVASLLANIHRKAGSRAFTYQDFMLIDAPTQRQRRTQQTLSWMKAVARPKGKGKKS